MTVLMISYDLKGKERPEAYNDVKEMIEEEAISCMRPLFSQWFVETEESVQTWHERMKAVTDKDDNWFILRVTKPRKGWLAKGVWTWLKERE